MPNNNKNMDKKKSMTTVGELKKVVGGMRKAQLEREDERITLQKNRNLGLAPDQDKAAAERIDRIRKENAYFAPIAERYQGVIDKAKMKVRNSKMPLAPTEFND